jgi:hypothetical protein
MYLKCNEEFENIKGVIRIRKSNDRQHNDQMKKGKRTNNDLQNTTQKTKYQTTVSKRGITFQIMCYLHLFK